MGLMTQTFLFCSLLIATPVLSQLPPMVPPELQQQQLQQQQQQQQQIQTQHQPHPQPLTQQQIILQQQQMIQRQLAQPQTGQPRQSNIGLPRVDFDFAGFFTYIMKIYGKRALDVFQEKLKQRRIVEGMADNTVPGLPIPCLLAPAFQGAVVTYSNPSRSHGSTATYKCDTGYQGTGAVIMCTSGTWSEPGVNITCAQMHCGPTPAMPHAQVSRTGDIMGSTASYTCDPGFQADHLASPVRCLADGTWSRPQFTCTNMMASNQAMSQMARMRSMMGGGMQGGMQGMMQQALGGGAGAMGGQGNPMMAALSQAMGAGGAPGAGVAGRNPMQAMMSGMMGGAAGANMAGAGGTGTGIGTGTGTGTGSQGGMNSMLQMMMGQQGGTQQALPPHLASLGSIAPMLMPTLMRNSMPGMGQTPGAPGAPGMPGAPGGKPLEPEQQQEQMMIRMMMQNMFVQNQRRQALMLQKRRQEEHRRQLLRKQQHQRQLEQQEKERRKLEQQQQAQQNSVNLSNILAMAGNAASNPEAMQALSSVLQKVSGGGGNVDLTKALQTLSTLAKVMNPTQSGSGTNAQSDAATSSSASGTGGGQEQSSSVFGNTGGEASSSSTSTSSNNPADTSSAGADVRAAIMAAGMQSG